MKKTQSLKFEEGKYYKHEDGRSIFIAGKVMTWKWGELWVIEETDKTGHAISCIEVGTEDLHDKWTAVGREEWKRDFGIVEA